MLGSDYIPMLHPPTPTHARSSYHQNISPRWCTTYNNKT